MTTRRTFLARAGLGALVAMGGAKARGEAAAAPANVVLVMSDEHAAGCASVYGHPSVRTPNLERLARRGTVYESAYCPSPLCMPSRSAFMSGQRVHAIQTYSNNNALNQAWPTYGAVLTGQGVHTALIGKTDVYRHSSELGFSELILPWDRAKPGDTLIRRNPLDIRRGAADRALGFGPAEGNPFAFDDSRVDAAVNWIDGPGRRLDAPWVLTVNLIKPHFPHYVTPALWDSYPDGGDLPALGPDEPSARHPYARDLRAHFETDQFNEAQVRGLRRGYLGCVTHTDHQLGRILDALGTAGLLENTVVAYTSDHGDMLGKFGMWWKCSLYEDSVRVPLVVAGPGFAPGARVRTPVDLLDLQAALFEAVGAARPADWDGVPLQHIAPADPDRVVFSEYHGHGTRSSAYLVRRGDWKLIHYAAAPDQLFNLAADPEERNNLAECCGQQRTQLEEALHAICDPARETARAEAMVERLLAVDTA